MSLATSNGWLPDVNSWLALSVARHEHRQMASRWWLSTHEPAYFCRVTQMGLLRLLTNPKVMGPDILTPIAAVSVYKQWLTARRVDFVHDLPGTEAGWLSFMNQPQTSGNAMRGSPHLRSVRD